MWKLWIASCYSHCSLWHQVPGCPHDVMDKLLNLTDKLRSSKDPTVRWCYLVFNLLGFSPSHYTETTYERVRANFWTDEFFICATRLIATVQILLLYCLHEPVQIFATVSIRMNFFLPKVRNCNPGQNILGLLRKLGAKTLLTKELIFFLLKKLGNVVIRAYFYCPPLSQAVLIVWKQNLII